MIEPVKEIMKQIVDMTKKKKSGCKGFQDKDVGEIQEQIDTTPE